MKNRPPQHPAAKYFAGVMGGTGFAVFFGCNFKDAIVAVIVSLMIVVVGKWLEERGNLFVYNTILSFLSEVIIVLSVEMDSHRSSGTDHDWNCYASYQRTQHNKWYP